MFVFIMEVSKKIISFRCCPLTAEVKVNKHGIVVCPECGVPRCHLCLDGVLYASLKHMRERLKKSECDKCRMDIKASLDKERDRVRARRLARSQS